MACGRKEFDLFKEPKEIQNSWDIDQSGESVKEESGEQARVRHVKESKHCLTDNRKPSVSSSVKGEE